MKAASTLKLISLEFSEFTEKVKVKKFQTLMMFPITDFSSMAVSCSTSLEFYLKV